VFEAYFEFQRGAMDSPVLCQLGFMLQFGTMNWWWMSFCGIIEGG